MAQEAADAKEALLLRLEPEGPDAADAAAATTSMPVVCTEPVVSAMY